MKRFSKIKSVTNDLSKVTLYGIDTFLKTITLLILLPFRSYYAAVVQIVTFLYHLVRICSIYIGLVELPRLLGILVVRPPKIF